MDLELDGLRVMVSAGAGGNVALTADRHVTVDATGSIASISGNISVTADQLAGNNAGAITLANGSTISTSGLVALTADGSVQLSSLTTTSAALNAVAIITTSGAITDADAGAATASRASTKEDSSMVTGPPLP